RTKHMDLRLQDLRQFLSLEQTVCLSHVSGTENPADIGTKSLPAKTFRQHRATLGVSEQISEQLMISLIMKSFVKPFVVANSLVVPRPKAQPVRLLRRAMAPPLRRRLRRKTPPPPGGAEEEEETAAAAPAISA